MSFQDLLRVQSAHVYVVRVTEDGEEVGYAESEPANINSSGDLEIPPDSMPPGAGATIIEAVLAHCAVAVHGGVDGPRSDAAGHNL